MLVSSSKTEITPGGHFFPCYLLGHAIRNEKAIGVADELWASALVLKTETEILIWISVDLAGFSKEASDHIKMLLAQRYGVKQAAINIGATHTHSGPEFDSVSPFFGKEKAGIPGYLKFVDDQIIKAVDQCFNQGFEDAEAYMSTVWIEGCYGNRNGKDKPGDKALTTIEFRNGERTVAGILHFSCHPTVLGPQNLLISADLAGYLARALQNRWGVYPLVMQGAAGDMSNRLFRQGNDYRELKRVGDEIISQFDACAKHTVLNLRPLKIKTVSIKKTFVRDLQRNSEIQAIIKEKIQNAKTFDEKKLYTSSLALVQCKPTEKEFHFLLECSLYKLGDLFVLAIPAELFSKFGLEIKQAMHSVCPIVWGYSNYSVGYLAESEEYGKTFESIGGDIPKGFAEEIVGEIIKTVKSMN